MIEPKAGIFLGRMTARIRDELWQKAVEKRNEGACLQLWSSSNEQGFEFRVAGVPSRQVVEIDGLHLVDLTRL